MRKILLAIGMLILGVWGLAVTVCGVMVLQGPGSGKGEVLLIWAVLGGLPLFGAWKMLKSIMGRESQSPVRSGDYYKMTEGKDDEKPGPGA